MSNGSTDHVDMLFFDMDYQDYVAMERTAIKEFVDTSQAGVLYILWDRIDKFEQSYREQMYPDHYFDSEDGHALDYS